MTAELTPLHLQALAYVRNTNGGATKAHFMEDHEPIGPLLYDALRARDLVVIDERGRVMLTDAARTLLEAAGG